MEIFSDDVLELQSILGTKIFGEKLKFFINDNIVKGNNLEIIDSNQNQYLLKNGYINLNTEEFVGKDVQVNFEKSTFGNYENDPRFAGRALNNNKDKTNIYKGVFTTCKKRENEDCPAWAIYADEIEHQKQKQIINYKNAWLKIYDVPVMYFPKFYHPDPTVKRQSGFILIYILQLK